MGRRIDLLFETVLVCLLLWSHGSAGFCQPSSKDKTNGPADRADQNQKAQTTGVLSPGKKEEPSVPPKKRELIWLEPKMATLSDTSRTGSATKTSNQVILRGGVYEKDLAIEWDDWRNKVAQTVLSRLFSNFAEALNAPVGLVSWYHCEVGRDGKIIESSITRSSGNLWYDHTVLSSVRKLDGDPVLEFPPGSDRTEVSLDIGIRLGGSPQYLQFGDTEHKTTESGVGAGGDAKN